MTKDLVVDGNSAGTYNGDVAPNNAIIAEGTMVDSHHFFFDPKESMSAIATFTFDQKIIGIIYHNGNRDDSSNLFRSDWLIPGDVPASAIPTSYFGARGLEGGSHNRAIWLDDYTLKFDLRASSPGDQVRVITQAVPEPGTIAAVGFGLAAFFRKRRKAA